MSFVITMAYNNTWPDVNGYGEHVNRDEVGTQTCYIHQCTNKCIACLCPNLVSVHFMQSQYYTSLYIRPRIAWDGRSGLLKHPMMSYRHVYNLIVNFKGAGITSW